MKNAVNYKNAKGEKKVWIPNPNGSMRGDIWDYPTLAGKRFENERTEHPTQKPESLITELIKAFCPMNSNVYNGTLTASTLYVHLLLLFEKHKNGS